MYFALGHRIPEDKCLAYDGAPIMGDREKKVEKRWRAYLEFEFQSEHSKVRWVNSPVLVHPVCRQQMPEFWTPESGVKPAKDKW